MLITRADGLVTTAQAARMVRRSPATIRKWVQRGHLEVAGLDERHNSLFDPVEVTAAERLVRENGLRASGVDPRPAAPALAA
jgi:helix-turn-helix protein